MSAATHEAAPDTEPPSSLFARAFAPYRALDRRIWVLAAARSVNTMGFSIVMPFMAMYLVEQRGASGSTYGLIYLIAGLSAAFSQAVAGEAADRFTRRQVMVAALTLRSFNMLFLGLAVVYAWPVVWLLVMMVINAVLRAAFEPAAAAAVTDLAPADQRVTAFGLQRIGINLGWALGPALGGAFSASYGGLFFFAAPITLIAAFAAATIRQPAAQGIDPGPAKDAIHALSKDSLRRLWSESLPFAIYLFLVLAGAVMVTQIFSTMSVYARTELGVSRERIGLLYTLNGALVVLLQVPAVALIERLGLKRVLVIGPLVYGAAYALMGFASGFPLLALSVSLLTAGEVLFAPALSDVAAYLGDPKRLGRAFGLFGLMQSFGISLGPMVGGTIYDNFRHDHTLMWSMIAVLSALVSLGYLAFVRRHSVEAL